MKIRNSATLAHFQAGVGERQGKWFKNIWGRVCKELSVTAEEAQLAATAVCSAKNCLRRRCGHSPYAWIFGREGRAIEDVLDPDSVGRVSFDVSDDARFQRLTAIRASARIAFHKSENDSKLLRSRWAYKDKNWSKRRQQGQAEWRCKSRLVIAGHTDPDLATGRLATDAPTLSRPGLLCLLQLLANGLHQPDPWRVSAGDIQCAFLTGSYLSRGEELFIHQPATGFPGMKPGQLVRVKKNIFGLATSPREWWLDLQDGIGKIDISIEGVNRRFDQCPLDPCIFVLRQYSGHRPAQGVHWDPRRRPASDCADFHLEIDRASPWPSFSDRRVGERVVQLPRLRDLLRRWRSGAVPAGIC